MGRFLVFTLIGGVYIGGGGEGSAIFRLPRLHPPGAAGPHLEVFILGSGFLSTKSDFSSRLWNCTLVRTCFQLWSLVWLLDLVWSLRTSWEQLVQFTDQETEAQSGRDSPRVT